jgi:hypothetical protein
LPADLVGLAILEDDAIESAGDADAPDADAPDADAPDADGGAPCGDVEPE